MAGPVANTETFHANLEVAEAACDRAMRRVVRKCRREAGNALSRSRRHTALGTSIVGEDVHHLEGKTKGPQSGETINESCRLPRRLRASA
jgi:hypothetical protein